MNSAAVPANFFAVQMLLIKAAFPHRGKVPEGRKGEYKMKEVLFKKAAINNL